MAKEFDREKHWEQKKEEKKEKQKEVLRFIDFLMEEYDLGVFEIENGAR